MMPQAASREDCHPFKEVNDCNWVFELETFLAIFKIHNGANRSLKLVLHLVNKFGAGQKCGASFKDRTYSYLSVGVGRCTDNV